MYMLKVRTTADDDKMHARSNRFTARVTQRRWGGKALFGGQRQRWSVGAGAQRRSIPCKEMPTVGPDDEQIA